MSLASPPRSGGSPIHGAGVEGAPRSSCGVPDEGGYSHRFREANERLVGSVVFNTIGGAKAPRRVRFPSASALASWCRLGPSYRAESRTQWSECGWNVFVAGLPRIRQPGEYRSAMISGRSASVPTLAVTGLIAHPTVIDEATIRGRAKPDDFAPDGTLVVSLGELLGQAEPAANASHVSAVSDDGLYSASIPLVEALSKGQLVVGAGETLARSAGGPFRLTVPGGSTLCWNVKSVGELRVTAGAEPDSVPENPTH